jgi:hypothetical protein
LWCDRCQLVCRAVGSRAHSRNVPAMSDLSEEECPSFLSPPSKRQRSPDPDDNDEDPAVAQGGGPVATVSAAVATAVPTARSAAGLRTPAAAPAEAAGTGGGTLRWAQGLTEDEKTAVEKALVKVKLAKESAKAKREATTNAKKGSGFREHAHRKPASEKAAPRVDKGTFAGHRPPKNPEKLRFMGLQKDSKKRCRSSAGKIVINTSSTSTPGFPNKGWGGEASLIAAVCGTPLAAPPSQTAPPPLSGQSPFPSAPPDQTATTPTSSAFAEEFQNKVGVVRWGAVARRGVVRGGV